MNDPAMTPDPQPLGNWQLSLANVMVFVFAVAMWFALMLSGSGALATTALFMIPAGLIAAADAWGAKRYALLILILFFEVILAFSSLTMASRYMRRLYVHREKSQQLHLIAEGMNTYYSDWNAYPPPPENSKMCLTELTRYLSMKRKNDPTQSYRAPIRSGTGNALKWELQSPDILILIDVGEDGVAGKYSVTEKEINKTPIDANHDGIDDGADDMVINRTRGGYE